MGSFVIPRFGIMAFNWLFKFNNFASSFSGYEHEPLEVCIFGLISRPHWRRLG